MPIPGSAEERYIKEVIAQVCYGNPGVLIKMSPREEVVGTVPGVWAIDMCDIEEMQGLRREDH